MFSYIRVNSGHCQNPTVSQFIHAFKSYCITSFSKSCNANCLPDGDLLLKFTEPSIPHDNQNDVNFIVPDNIDYSQCRLLFAQPTLTLCEKNIVAYVAGFVSKLLSKNNNCEKCQEEINSTSLDDLPNEAVVFYMHKNFDWQHLCLTLPSLIVYNFCCYLECNFRKWRLSKGDFPNYPAASFQSHVLLSMMNSSYNSLRLTCDSHETRNDDFIKSTINTFFSVRYHFLMTLTNRQLSTINQRCKFMKLTGK